MFGNQPAYPEKLLHKKESLQNQLINIRVELSQASTVSSALGPRSQHRFRRATPPGLCSLVSDSLRRARAGWSWPEGAETEDLNSTLQISREYARPLAP